MKRLTIILIVLLVATAAFGQGDLRYHNLLDLRASAQTVPNMTVRVASSIVMIGGTQVTYAGGNSPTFTAPGTDKRIDLLTLDSTGTLAITQGVAAGSPSPPAYVAGKLPICEVYLKSTSTSITAYNDGVATHGYLYADVRPILQIASASAAAHALLSAVHSDTTAAAVARGAIITGQTGPVWAKLLLGGAGKLLRSDGTDLGYGDVTYPASTNINTLLYSSGANALAGLATGNSGVLVTSSGGVPSIGTDIPTAVTIGTKYIYRAEGTDVPVTDGGTGVSTLTIAYGLLGAGTTATGNVQTLAAGLTTQILVGGGVSALPAWGTDLPTAVTIGTKYIYRATGTDVAVADGGTNLSTIAAGSVLAANSLDTLTAITSTSDTKVLQNAAGTISWASTAAPGAHNLLSASHGDTTGASASRGALVIGQGASPTWATYTLGTVGKVLRSDGTDALWSAVTYPASTTSGRVVYSTGTSALGDDADLTFDGAALTVTNLVVSGATAAGKAMIQRASTQYWDLYGTAGGNYLTGVSDAGAIKPIFITNNQASSTNFTIGSTNIVGIDSTGMYPSADSTSTSGTSSKYWLHVYADALDLNSTASLSGANPGRIGPAGTFDSFSMTASNNLTFSAGNIITDTTTGTKIGTGTTQKLGFFNATPVIQQTGDVATALSNLGLVASPTVSATGAYLGMYVHTSGTTHRTGATCHTIIVELVGGGAGGGNASSAVSQAAAGGGGGGGGYARKAFTVSVSSDYTYAVGAGGAASAAGGNTTFAVGATTVTAYGGSDGIDGFGGISVVATVGGAGGIVSTNGDVNATGQPGGWGLRTGTTAVSGVGAPSHLGGGGNAVATVTATSDGVAGGAYGSGGSGAATEGDTSKSGGAGSAGIVIVWEFM